ncbi:MAG: glycyl-radical enzyme activating protein [Deltaproteobacteria bacterium]|nr:MAG: glycyl-radical enzyme activating protein [Deltaproteobacteria bacterium]
MSNKSIRGKIVNLQDYSVHDGYGIRTLVFMKGCPLGCPWCQNPESIKTAMEIKYSQHLCIECFKCREVCDQGAILEDRDKRIDLDRCNYCMRCVKTCPSGALSQVGATIAVEEIVKKLLSYKPFYDSSEKGGITLSGGEPTFQPEFALELLKECKEHGIHTAMETCGYTNFETLKWLVQFLDLLLYDLKHMDGRLHKEATGVSNELILENLKKLSAIPQIECVIRIPLIPGFNDDEENVRQTAEFVEGLNIKKLDLLPFNELPSGKYRTLGIDWVYKQVKRQDEMKLLQLKEIVEGCGLEATIGGLW